MAIHPPYPEPRARTVWASPIGALLLVAGEQALLGCWFRDQHGIPGWAHQAPEQPDHALLREAIAQLQAYLEGRRHGFELPLDCSRGTAFQQAVWQALTTVPRGQTISYGELARVVGRPRAVRAVGGAVGRNPLGIILPCHRVIGGNGALTGYTGGLERKIALLRLEQARVPLQP